MFGFASASIPRFLYANILITDVIYINHLSDHRGYIFAFFFLQQI